MALEIKDGSVSSKYFNVIEAGTSGEPFESVVPDYRIPYAMATITRLYADTVSVREKSQGLIMLGENPSLSTSDATIWETGGTETYKTANDIDVIVSSNAGDTQDVVIEGHTVAAGVFTYVSQTATLNGTTNVTLTTPLSRVSKVYNNDSTDFAGTITVVDNGTSTHLTILAGDNQSQKCATTLSSVDYLIITGIDIGVKRTTSATVDFKLQVRESGKVFRTLFQATETNGGRSIRFDQPIIVPPNSDVRMVGNSSIASTVATAAIHGYLAIVT